MVKAGTTEGCFLHEAKALRRAPLPPLLASVTETGSSARPAEVHEALVSAAAAPSLALSPKPFIMLLMT